MSINDKVNALNSVAAKLDLIVKYEDGVFAIYDSGGYLVCWNNTEILALTYLHGVEYASRKGV